MRRALRSGVKEEPGGAALGGGQPRSRTRRVRGRARS